MNCVNFFESSVTDTIITIKPRRATYPLKSKSMLRSRDTSKNAHQQNGIQVDEPPQSSTFTKYGLLVCVLFTIIVAYFVFFDNNSSSSSSLPSNQLSTASISSPLVPKSANTPPGLSSSLTAQSLPSGPKGKGFGPYAAKGPQTMANNPLTQRIARQAMGGSKMMPGKSSMMGLRQKVIGDLNPMENDKLQRLMQRQRAGGMNMPGMNRLNGIFNHKLGPLQQLTGPQPGTYM